MLTHPGNEVGFVHGTGYAGRFSAIFKQNQGRDAADIHFRGQVLLHFGVNLHQPRKRLQLKGSLGKYGGHHFTGPAPRRPEIHQQWNLAATDMLVKS